MIECIPLNDLYVFGIPICFFILGSIAGSYLRKISDFYNRKKDKEQSDCEGEKK